MSARWLSVWAAMVACNAWLLAAVPDAPAAAAECHADDDCVLLPSELSCCGECPPAPPFHAAPRWVLDGMLVESETTCSYDARSCTPMACDPVPPGCVARPACEAGRCVARTSGCGEHLASDRSAAGLSGSVGGGEVSRIVAIQTACARTAD